MKLIESEIFKGHFSNFTELSKTNGNLDFKITFNDSKSHLIDRSVSSVTVTNGVDTIDFGDFLPPNCGFFTHRGVNKHNKYEQSIPTAFILVDNVNEMKLYFNPDIFDLRGGALILLHEAGHGWDRLDSKNWTKASLLKDRLKNSENKQTLKNSILKLRERENKAWMWAIWKYHQIKEQNFDIAPQLDKGEVIDYPQAIYDAMYNRDFANVISRIGDDYKLKFQI